MEKFSYNESNVLLDQFINKMDKAITDKLILEKKEPDFLNREERWELISIKYIKEVGSMIEKAKLKFDFINEKVSKEYIDNAIKRLAEKKINYLNRL
tara:strand:- start:274 stop:564 length:291 start_codon:yes stop_codon:yes gene_type:complete